MKKVTWALVALLIAALACNAPTSTEVAATEVEATEVVATEVAATPVEATEVAATEVAATAAEATNAPATDEPTTEPTTANGTATPTPTLTPSPTPVTGFANGNIENPNLPDVEVVATGGPPLFCGGSRSPQASILAQIGGTAYLCLDGYPSEGVNRMRVDADTTNYSYFSEFFTDDGIIYGPESEERGRITEDGGWLLTVTVPSWLPQGTWEISAQLTDGTLPSSTTFEPLDFPVIFITGLDPLPNNPLLFPYELSSGGAYEDDDDLLFAPGDEITFGGINYPASTTVTVALYKVGEGTTLTGLAATTVTTDANGEWLTTYLVPDDAEAGGYRVVVNPDPEEPISPFNGFFGIDN